MSELSPDTNRLLALARGASTLTDERRLQIKAGLLSQIAAGGALTGTAATHAAWGKAAWLSSPLLKGLSALALLSAVGVGVYVGARAPQSGAPDRASAVTQAREVNPSSSPNPNAASPGDSNRVAPSPRPSAAEAEQVAPRPIAPTPVVQPAVAFNPSNPKPTASSSHSAPVSESAGDLQAAPKVDTLAGETSLLRDADQALRSGNAARALSLLEEHAARYPRGVLAPERNAERVIARCKLGQIDAKSAESYLALHPNSPFAARIQDACGRAH
jgi:hypothetical protein